MSNCRLTIVLPVGLVMLLGLLIGCNSTPTGTKTSADYRVAGVLIQEMNFDHAYAVVRFWRNDTTLTNASIRLAGVPMAFFPLYQSIDSAYQALISPAAAHAGSQAYFRTADASRFADSLLVSIVDTFSINDNIDPPNHQLQGAGQVSLEWTASAYAQGYILAAVKTSRAYTGVGYSDYAATVGTAGTIPPDAFADPITGLPDTGLYNIYVYAYRDAPDSALAGKFLPVPLPQQRPENIDRTSLSGRFGTIAVTLKDTIRVVTGP